MRFLANENMPGDAIDELRAAGFDTIWVRSEAPGMGDRDVLSWAVREARILLTFDKDFGELAFASGLPAACGVILFRMPMPRSSTAGALLARLVSSRTDWAVHFSVIEPGRVRMRALPGV